MLNRCERWLVSQAHNIDIVFGCFDEPIIQVCITCKEPILYFRKSFRAQKESTSYDWKASAWVPFDIIFFGTDFNQVGLKHRHSSHRSLAWTTWAAWRLTSSNFTCNNDWRYDKPNTVPPCCHCNLLDEPVWQLHLYSTDDLGFQTAV